MPSPGYRKEVPRGWQCFMVQGLVLAHREVELNGETRDTECARAASTPSVHDKEIGQHLVLGQDACDGRLLLWVLDENLPPLPQVY